MRSANAEASASGQEQVRPARRERRMCPCPSFRGRPGDAGIVDRMPTSVAKSACLGDRHRTSGDVELEQVGADR